MNKRKSINPVLDTLIKSSVTFFLLLIVWAVVSRMNVFSSFVFPSPKKVFKAFVTMTRSGELLRNLTASLIRVISGFFISCVLAFVFAVTVSFFPSPRQWLKGVFEYSRNVPPISLIPLLILWFGIGELSKLIVIVLASFFPIYMNFVSGIAECDQKLVEAGKSLNMSQKSIFFKIMLPSAVPQILTGMQIGLGYSWRAIVGAEMIAATKGLGYMILDSQSLSRTDKVIAGIICIGISGIIMDTLFKIAINSLNRKKQND